MPQIIDIPGVGQVEFPDGMSDDEIASAARRLAVEASPSMRLVNPDVPAAPSRPKEEGILSRIGGAVKSGMTGLAHGISSGTGPISRLVKDTMIRPDELKYVEEQYAKDPSLAAAAGDFVGGAYTPESAMLGSAVGGALGAARRAVAGRSAVKAGEALGGAATSAANKAEGALASETGRLGGFAQDMNRQTEWLDRLLDPGVRGGLSTPTVRTLEAFRGSPEYAAVLEKGAERVLDKLPGAVQKVTAQQGRVAQMTADLPRAVVNNTMEAVSPRAARAQVAARLKRYWPRLAAAGVGGIVGGPVGAGAGAAIGFAGGPMVRAAERMLANPAVQYQGYKALGRLTQSPVAGAVNRGLSFGIPALTSQAMRPEDEIDPDILAAAEKRRKGK